MPRTIKTTLELGGESAYKKGLESVDRALKAMSKEISEATAKFSENATSLKNVSSVSNAYKNSIEQQKIKVDSLKGAVETCNKKYEDAVQKYEKAAAANGENSAEALKAADALYKAEKALDGYKSKLASAEKYLESSQQKMKEFTGANKNIIALADSVEKVKEKFSSLSGVQSVSKKFEELKDKAGKIADKFQPITSNIKKVGNAISPVKGAFELAGKKAAEIKEKLEPAISVCKNVAKEAAKISFKAAEASAKAAKAGINAVGTAVDGAKKAFTMYTGAMATAGFGIGSWAAKTGKEFDAQMSTVASISGATSSQLAELTAKAKEMGATTSFSATESAQALEYMAMAGWKTQDMIGGLPGIINLAAASGEELATVSDIVTDAMTAFGLSADESSHFADVLAKTASSANTNVGMMGETFKYVAPVAGAMKFSVEDVSTAIGLMANSGIKGSQAGTALRSTISRLAKPTKESATAMNTLGLSITNSDGTMKSFMDIMLDMRNSFSGLTEDEKACYAAMLGGQEAMSGLLSIVNASESDFTSLTKSINDCNGAAKNMSDIRLDNLQGDITLLKSNLEGVALSTSGMLTPALRFLVKSASGIVTAFSDRGIGGALLQFEYVISKMIDNITKRLPSVLPKLISGFNSVITGVAGAIVKSLPVVTGTILPELITGFQSLASSLIGYLPQVLPVLLDGFFTLFSGLIDSLNLVIEQLIPMLPTLIEQISSALITNLPVLLNGAMTLFMGLIQSLDQIVTLLTPKLPAIISQIASILVANLPVLLNGAMQLFLGLIKALDDVIYKLTPMLPEIITGICDTLIANIDKIISAGFDLLVGLIDGITECIPTLLEKVPEIIEKLVSSLTDPDNLDKLIGSGIDLIVALAEGLPKAIPYVLCAIPEIITSIISRLMEQDWLQVGIDIVRGLADGLIDGVNVIWEKIKEMANNLLDSIKSALGIASPSKLFKKEVGPYLAQGIGIGFEDEMKNVTKQMQKAVPSDFDTVVNADVNSFRPIGDVSNITKTKNVTVYVNLEKIFINNDDDFEENAYKLENMCRKAALSIGDV